MLFQGAGLADAVDADHETEAAGATGLDAGERVLEDRGLLRFYAEPSRTFQERIRRGLALEPAFGDRVAVDDLREAIDDPDRTQDVLGVGRRRDDRELEASIARRVEV